MGRRPLKTFTQILNHFIIISRTTVIVARLVNTTDNEQQQGPPPLLEPVAACLVVPSKVRGYRQGEPSPYLISRVLLEKLDFRSLVTLAEYDQGPSTPVTSVVPSLSFPTQYLSRAPLGRPTFLPLRTTAVQEPRAAIQSQQRVEYEDYSSISHT